MDTRAGYTELKVTFYVTDVQAWRILGHYLKARRSQDVLEMIKLRTSCRES